MRRSSIPPHHSRSPAEGSRDDPNQAPPGTLRFGLHARQDVGSLLKVENSQGEGLKYSGFVVRFSGGRARGPDAWSAGGKAA